MAVKSCNTLLGRLGELPDVSEPRLRLLLVCRLAGVKYTEIERAEGLSAGKISAYCTHRVYAYPKLRRAVSEHIGRVIGADPSEVRAYVFGEASKSIETKKPARRRASSQPASDQDRGADTS